ncbi:DUF418 domain-containing protein [Catenovulum sp. SM1970]|uniref:DUF418 domain-containing protein n=1 Tax=Marinifaba aquimaris TaxID=2741323 RepID=UPI001571D05A|nr:DUF418 domain-containing protein [Marinifaba aquimaris]NTS78816.1 DUF418 domain-containing protein [Marinifaba aquimaris]
MNQTITLNDNRDSLLDALRGFAIFGIFFINITIMHSIFMFQDAYIGQFQDQVNLAVNRLLQLFFYNKFFPIFTFLFGLGLTLQMQAKMNKQQRYRGFFIRRMLILFVLGLLHCLLIWSGDVLHLYALLGLVSLALIKLLPRYLVFIAGCLLVFPYYGALAGMTLDAIPFVLEQSLIDYGEQGVIETIRQGTYAANVAFRWHEYLANLPMLLFYLAPMALAMFCLGMAAGKSTLKLGTKAWVEHFKRLAVLTFIVVNVYRVYFLWFLPETALYQSDVLKPWWFKLMFLSDVLLGLTYIWLIAWLWHHTSMNKILSLFALVGRMALSHYLLQSLIGLILFTQVGFALYQRLSPVECFTIAFFTFGLQVLLSFYWLKYFKFGPFEWLWRCASYRTWFALKRNNDDNVAYQSTKNI